MSHLNNKGKIISEASVNATLLKDKSALLGFLTATNSGEEEAYLKVYDQETEPDVGTDVPTFTFLIPAGNAGAGSNLGIPFGGIDFGRGLAIAITGGEADDDATAVDAGQVIVNYAFRTI